MRITFRLNPGRDGDLIKWLQELPDDPGMSCFIRQALRQHIHPTGGPGFLFRDYVGQGRTARGEALQLPQVEAQAAAKPGPKEVDEKQLEQALAAWSSE